MNQTLAEGPPIWGILAFKDQLYVGRSGGHIEIYSIPTLSFQRSLTIPGLGCIDDMTSCPGCDVLFISDHCNNLTHVIDGRGLAVSWKVDDTPSGLSVNSHLNVLITFTGVRKLREFTPSGQLVREISLQSDMTYPKHAIQLDNQRYAVVHGKTNSTGLHRVCIVNSIGTIIQSYGGNKGSGLGQLHSPLRLAVFGGSIIVSDYNNKRLLLFNSSTLTFIREIMSSDRWPIQMSIDENGNRLYLAENTFGYTNGRMKVIDLVWNL